MNDKIRIGVSSCLLGNQVRFDGGHKRNGFLADTLKQFVEFVPVCPEVDIGMGTPRQAVRLRRDNGDVRMLGTKSGADFTAKMKSYSERRTRALGAEDLSGYVLKKDSPSCGMERVRLYAENGTPARDGVGLFAAALDAPLSEPAGRGRRPSQRSESAGEFCRARFCLQAAAGFFRRALDPGRPD